MSRGKVRVVRSKKAPVTVGAGLALAARAAKVRRIRKKARKSMLRRAAAAKRLAVTRAAILEVNSPRPGARVELDGKLVLHGRYQAIQNRKSYTHKPPPENYRYLVVSSWEYGK